LLISLDNESKAFITQTFSPVNEKIITVDYPQVEDMITHGLRRMRNAVIEKVRNIRKLFSLFQARKTWKIFKLRTDSH